MDWRSTRVGGREGEGKRRREARRIACCWRGRKWKGHTIHRLLLLLLLKRRQLLMRVWMLVLQRWGVEEQLRWWLSSTYQKDGSSRQGSKGIRRKGDPDRPPLYLHPFLSPFRP